MLLVVAFALIVFPTVEARLAIVNFVCYTLDDYLFTIASILDIA